MRLYGYVCPHYVCVGGVFVYTERLVDVGFGRHGVGLLQFHAGASEIGVVKAGVVSYYFVEGFAGGIVFLDVDQRERAVEEQLSVARQQLESLGVVVDCSAVFAEILARHSSNFPRVCKEWVKFQRLCGICFGSVVVFEVELGYGAEEVWLGEIGLGLYGLVEVLYGQHIVFKIECILAYAQHLLSVYLRP